MRTTLTFLAVGPVPAVLADTLPCHLVTRPAVLAQTLVLTVDTPGALGTAWYRGKRRK